MDDEHILSTLAEIRTSLGYRRGTRPAISDLYVHPDNSVHIVASDRSEKSLFLGPGGRVVAQLARRLGVPVTVYGQDEILVRKHRLTLTKSRIDELQDGLTTVQTSILGWLRRLVESELLFPETPHQNIPYSGPTGAASIAFSGGTDSTAALVIMRRAGMRPVALTIDLGSRTLTHLDKKRILATCSEIGVAHSFVTPPDGMDIVYERAQSGDRHPCNQCHTLMYQTLFEHARDRGLEILATGELLPTGRQSLICEENLLVVHLPAALALSKFNTLGLAGRGSDLSGEDGGFGCDLVRATHKFGWRMAGPSILRVLRELDGGVLSTGQALNQVKAILRDSGLRDGGLGESAEEG